MPNAPTIESAIRNPRPAIALPELLAPAGDWECAKAAVENGADAIYFGLERFNARMRAHNFTEADLPKLMEFLHRRGVKGYVTFNTLVFANEMEDAEQYLRSIISAGVDAAIVQDIGICRLIRKLSPDFPIHASTQMTITSAAGVEFAKELGCNLVVLARECSLKEIEKIRLATSDLPPLPVTQERGEGWGEGQPIKTSKTSPHPGPLPSFRRSGEGEEASASSNAALPLEVFVHGALCVAYSGQCLTSESLGGRSANRGECAQACRMPYELISDGKNVPLGDKRYLLSPQDLAGLEVLPELVRAGVASLKIEGRLKTPEYVANITKIYRQALDTVIGNEGRLKGEDPSRHMSPVTRHDMEMAFSRGLYSGWFRGNNNQELVHARFGKKRGVYLGEVKRIERDKIILQLEAPLKPGDGVVFDSGHPDQKEEGGRIYEIISKNRSGRRSKKSSIRHSPSAIDQSLLTSAATNEVALAFGHGDLDFSRIHIGDKLWKTSDPELDRRLRQTFAGEKPQFQRPIQMELHGRAGAPLTMIARDDLGNVVQLSSEMPLVKAEKQPLTEQLLRDQLGRLGGTPFHLGEMKSRLEGDLILPISELNRLRREAVTQLETLRAQPKRWTLVGTSPTSSLTSIVEDKKNGGEVELVPTTQLVVLVRSLPQLEAALLCGSNTIYCDFENPKNYREAVTTFHTARGCKSESLASYPKPSIFVAPPRIFKMGEDWILKQVRSCDADGYLVRNYDHLKFFKDCRCVGDFSFNVANRLTAEYFKERFSFERITPSYDLNNVQLEALLKSAPPEWFEVTIHQHMPMFHMEHCVFCAFLSKGTDYTNCGRPCDKHEVKLRDRVGMEHPLKADIGCRNTVFNARAQTGAESVGHLLSIGVRHFRIEFVNETPEEVTRTISQYRQLLRGEISGTQLWRELKLINQLGVTRGQMEKS